MIWGAACVIAVYCELVHYCDYAKLHYPKEHANLTTSQRSIMAHVDFKPAVPDTELMERQQVVKKVLTFAWLSFALMPVVIVLGYVIRR